MENSMLIAGYVWNGKNAKNKLEGANKTSKESGIATVLTKTTEEMGTDLEKTIIMWEKVLKEFASTKDKQPLIDYERGKILFFLKKKYYICIYDIW